MRTTLRLLIAALLIVPLLSCGKKTEPVVKKYIEVPVPSEYEIFNTREGVMFRSGQSSYLLHISRAEYDPECGCLSEYKPLTSMKGGEVFTDTDVAENVRYVYKLRNEHIPYKILSDEAREVVIYAEPIFIESVQASELPGRRYTFEVETNRPFERLIAFAGDRKAASTIEDEFTVNFTETDTGTLTIYAYDEYGNAGEPKVVSIFAEGGNKPDAPFSLKTISAEGKTTISWMEPEGVWLYNVYRMKGDAYEYVTRVDLPYYMFRTGDEPGCSMFAVSSLKNGAESEKTVIEVCYP
ncbi:hypothetical protein [Limisalsivibrio acetivorans]|uniref:hypothetical protein n=1 Tax=Limisalsivibrio acetivorans TaxID=1304888 RepID=UPI0003B523A8|nr:hypothetical protein [Limisalsivibrio acetivorans]